MVSLTPKCRQTTKSHHIWIIAIPSIRYAVEIPSLGVVPLISPHLWAPPGVEQEDLTLYLLSLSCHPYVRLQMVQTTAHMSLPNYYKLWIFLRHPIQCVCIFVEATDSLVHKVFSVWKARYRRHPNNIDQSMLNSFIIYNTLIIWLLILLLLPALKYSLNTYIYTIQCYGLHWIWIKHLTANVLWNSFSLEC